MLTTASGQVVNLHVAPATQNAPDAQEVVDEQPVSCALNALLRQ